MKCKYIVLIIISISFVALRLSTAIPVFSNVLEDVIIMIRNNETYDQKIVKFWPVEYPVALFINNSTNVNDRIFVSKDTSDGMSFGVVNNFIYPRLLTNDIKDADWCFFVNNRVNYECMAKCENVILYDIEFNTNTVTACDISNFYDGSKKINGLINLK